MYLIIPAVVLLVLVISCDSFLNEYERGVISTLGRYTATRGPALVDGEWSLLGSTSIDSRSFGLNDEINLLVLSDELATQLHATFEADLAQSSAINLAAWQRRSWGERILATLGRVLERHQ